MYKILDVVAQEAPKKSNSFVDFVNNQPVLFGVSVVVGLLVISVGVIGLYISKKKKRR